MTDISFNGKVKRVPLFRFRRANAPSFEYIEALSLNAASQLLASVGIDPEVLQFEGYLITPLRKDVV